MTVEAALKQTITHQAASAVSKMHPNAAFRTPKYINLEDVYNFLSHRNTLVHFNISNITFRCTGLVNITLVCYWGGVVLTNTSNTTSGLVYVTRSAELEKCLKN